MPNPYTHIIDVNEAKRYLRLDPDYTEEDLDIEGMIAGALSFIEKKTGHVFRVQDKTYHKGFFEHIDVYDFPINTVPGGVEVKVLPGYSRFEGESVTLNIGYISRDSVPYDLIQAALQILKVWYYEAEKNENTTILPMNVLEIINSNKRFFAC